MPEGWIFNTWLVGLESTSGNMSKRPSIGLATILNVVGCPNVSTGAAGVWMIPIWQLLPLNNSLQVHSSVPSGVAEQMPLLRHGLFSQGFSSASIQ